MGESLTNLSIVADAPFGDDDAFSDFLGVHEVAHQTIASRIASKGGIITTRPLSDTPKGNPDWLLDHYDIHRQIGSALGVNVSDISQVDLTNREQYDDWMQTHGQLHSDINAVLGIYS